MACFILVLTSARCDRKSLATAFNWLLAHIGDGWLIYGPLVSLKVFFLAQRILEQLGDDLVLVAIGPFDDEVHVFDQRCLDPRLKQLPITVGVVAVDFETCHVTLL